MWLATRIIRGGEDKSSLDAPLSTLSNRIRTLIERYFGYFDASVIVYPSPGKMRGDQSGGLMV